MNPKVLMKYAHSKNYELLNCILANQLKDKQKF